MSAWWVVYLIPLLSVWTWQVARRRRIAVKGREAHVQAQLQLPERRLDRLKRLLLLSWVSLMPAAGSTKSSMM